MKYIKYYFGMALLGLASCQKDNPAEELSVKEEAIVSAVSLHEAQEKLSRERMNESLRMLPDWKSFSTEEVVQGFEYSQVRTAIFNSEIEGEMVFFKVRDTLLSYLLMHQIDEEKPAIERYVFFTPDGFFVDGYVFEEGEITHRMVSSRLAGYEVGRNCREIQQQARKNGDPDWKLRCYDLEEVVVVHNREKNANKCKNVTGKSGSCEAWLSSSDVSLLYDCLPDDIDCMDRKIRAEMEAARQDVAYHRKNYRGGGKELPKEIINDLKETCAGRIVEQIRNVAKMKTFLQKQSKLQGGQHNFSEMIIDLFENSKNVKLVFQLGPTGRAYATTRGTKITISKSYLRRATNLSVALTIIHETIHAYLNATYNERNDISDKSFRGLLKQYYKDFQAKQGKEESSNRLHHEFMGEPELIEGMATSLQQWDMRYGSGTDLGYDYYRAMSFAGLHYNRDVLDGEVQVDVDSFKALKIDNEERLKIKQIIENEENGYKNAKGTKCK